MPVTPREPSLVDVLKGRPVGARDGKPSGGKGVRIVQEREPLDEGEVEKRRNERRRNEARNAIKVNLIWRLFSSFSSLILALVFLKSWETS